MCVCSQCYNLQLCVFASDGDRELVPNYIVLVTYGNTADPIAATDASITSRVAGSTIIVAGVADMLKHKLMYQCKY